MPQKLTNRAGHAELGELHEHDMGGLIATALLSGSSTSCLKSCGKDQWVASGLLAMPHHRWQRTLIDMTPGSNRVVPTLVNIWRRFSYT
jgi:hypothetical protein